MRDALERAERELGAIDLVVAAGAVAGKALDGRESIELTADADPDEALANLVSRLSS